MKLHKLYRIDILDPHEGNIVAWSTSREHASALGKSILKDFDHPCPSSMSITKVEFEATRQGLAYWLNKNFTRDNG